MKKISLELNVYELHELKELNREGYLKALEAERERQEADWEYSILFERFDEICEELGEPELEIASWEPHTAPLLLTGKISVPSGRDVARLLADEEPLVSVKIGEDPSWTGWRYYVHSDQISDEEGEEIRLKKARLEKEIGEKLYADLTLYTAEHTLVEYAEGREAFYLIDGTAFPGAL